MNNTANSVVQALNQQHSHINNQQIEIPIKSQLNSTQIMNTTGKLKKSPIIPTPLYVYFPFFLSIIII